MNTLHRRLLHLALWLLCLGAVVPAAGQAPARADTISSAMRQEAAASRHVNDATAVVRKLAGVPQLHGVLGSAKGVFIVPSYGRAAVGIGAAGGTGILLARQPSGSWSDPVFYNTGGLSVGLQAGAEGGALVLVLNNEKAVKAFLKKNNFSLNARAGLTLVNWNKLLQGSAGAGDVVVWSDTSGLFGDLATVEVNDIRFKQKMNKAYYHRSLAATDVIGGKTTNLQSAPLVEALLAVAGPSR